MPKPYETFGFSESEALFNRVSHARFQDLLDDEQVSVHRIELSSNNYGEFLFITASRPSNGERSCVTFFGLGFHDWRERWLVDQWFWYRSNPTPETFESTLSRDETEKILRERLETIRPFVTNEPPSEQGELFALLADLTDEDHALIEMEDRQEFADSHDF